MNGQDNKLNKLIGFDIVKKQIKSIIASDVVEKERRKRKGKEYQSCSMNMIFGGNPGSAKTTVAKLFEKSTLGARHNKLLTQQMNLRICGTIRRMVIIYEYRKRNRNKKIKIIARSR